LAEAIFILQSEGGAEVGTLLGDPAEQREFVAVFDTF
jgi:hypothetical protein